MPQNWEGVYDYRGRDEFFRQGVFVKFSGRLLQVVGLDAVAAQLDHICRVAGNARHAAIGSDLDGGDGTEQCPRDLDTIVDLQQIPALLAGQGYEQAQVETIMHGNWIRFFERAWI